MNFLSPTNYVRDSNGFTLPNFGGPVGVEFGTLYHSQVTATELFRLPAGAVPVQFITNVTQVFNGTTALTIALTHPSGTFGAAIGVGTATQVLSGYVAGSLFIRYAEDTPVYGRYADTVSTAGTAVVACLYMLSDV